MVLTPHLLVGGAVASKARTSAGALGIGALTHLLLDAVPHRDYRLGALGGSALALDATVGTLAVCRLSRRSHVVLAGALGGALPDLIRIAERRLGVVLSRRMHDAIHTDHRPSAWRSAAVQGLVAVSAALVLAERHRGRAKGEDIALTLSAPQAV